jgi:hypothetical protein
MTNMKLRIVIIERVEERLEPKGRRRSKGRKWERQISTRGSREERRGWNVGFAWGFDKGQKENKRKNIMLLENYYRKERKK